MQRWSKLFIPTLREAPADAEVASHKLLLRAGYIRQLGAGLYSYLFLGQRSLNKIIAIVREEMDTIAQEFLLPALNPREIWEESGRWTGMGQNMFRLTDRKGAELCLGMTHEEIMTGIARNELRSYKQLPQIWYQIQNKFRDEPRPKSGLLRVRQFTMKDAYSFDIDAADLDESYRKHDAVYRRIFSRCGLEFVAVDADSGAMGGSQSQEFMVYTDAGEDLIANCPVCGYAANVEKATSRLEPVKDLAATGDGKPDLVHTPGKGAIADVAAFLKIAPEQDIKCIALMVQFQHWQPIVALLRGDHELNEAKLLGTLGARELRFMTNEELATFIHGPAGFLGPIGFNTIPANEWEFTLEEFQKPYEQHQNQMGEVIVVMDNALAGRNNMIAGANKIDYHLRNVTPGRDFTPTLTADVRNANEGEGCPTPNCTGKLKVAKAVEVGHIFKLGYKYTQSMGATVLDQNGKEVTPIMGSYGIGIERILTAAIEQAAAIADAREKEAKGNHPKFNTGSNSFALPANIAPFEVVVTVTNSTDAALAEAGETAAAALEAAGVDVLLDDRDERAGVKFKDADLVGIPLRLNIGKKLAEGKLELVDRLRGQTLEIAVAEAVTAVKNLLE